MKTRISLCCDNCKEPVIEFFVDDIRDIVDNPYFYLKENRHRFKTGKEYYIQEGGKGGYMVCKNCGPVG